MSLDVTLIAARPTEVYSANITHNLGKMAAMAHVYSELWRPEEIGIRRAADLISPLTNGLGLLESCPDLFTEYNPKNGWGSYDHLVQFVRDYLKACTENPDATIDVSR